MKRNGFTLIEFVIVLVILGILAAILFPVFGNWGRHGYSPRSACQSNLKQIGLGFLQYTQDYNEKFPLISAGDQGWADTIQPYMKSWQLFQCPNGGERNPDRSSDYFFNARASGVSLEKINFAAQSILAGDGFDNGATNSHLSELPLDWKTDEKSPARRHLDIANYLFVDGHVKSLKPETISKQPATPKNGYPTFAVR